MGAPADWGCDGGIGSNLLYVVIEARVPFFEMARSLAINNNPGLR